MYQLFKGKRALTDKHFLNTYSGANLFLTYDQARAALRSYIRKMVKAGKLASEQFGWFDSISRNPSRLGEFNIKKMA
jgi:hypothetical protein